MTKQAETVQLLLQLSEISKRLANHLAETVLAKPLPQIVIEEPRAAVTLNPSNYEQWPRITQQPPDIQWIIDKTAGKHVLELGSTSYIAGKLRASRTDLITDQYANFEPQQQIKLVGLDKLSDKYDAVVIYEALEEREKWGELLLYLKRFLKTDGSMFIAFRPWTAFNGGFQDSYFPLAYAHLVADISDKVKTKITQPLNFYQSMFGQTKLNIVQRKVHQHEPPAFITSPEILDVIIQRTWGIRPPDEATQVLKIASVHYQVAL